MILQRPNDFEFTIELLEDLAFYSSIGIFKELMFNNEKSRERFSYCVSIKDYMKLYTHLYFNNEFDIYDDNKSLT